MSHEEKEIRFIEMFSGVGGFRLGLERANNSGHKERQDTEILSANGSHSQSDIIQRTPFRCVWANDNYKYANKVYKKNFGAEELVEGDIREIKAKDVPDCDLLTAGFPCQAFSVAGKRKATKEARGTLFTHIARVAAYKRPKFLLLENVKGLLSSESGRTFAIILRTLGNLGYLLEWQVLNSKHFGVPQNRPRVFVIGHLRREGGRQIFPISEAGELSVGPPKDKPESWEASTLEASYGKTKNLSNMILSHSVRSGGRGSLDRHSWDLVKVGDLWEGSQCRVYDSKGIAPTLHKSGGKTEPVILADRTRTYAGLGRNLESPKNITNALSSVQKDNLVVANAVDCDGYLRFGHRPRDENGRPQLIPIGYRRIRRLTPTECERLQGFPDGWTEGVSDTQRYKLLGNAVTVNVIEFLGRRLREIA